MGTAYGISNCVGWYRSGIGVFSDAGSTPANNGDNVAMWQDQSGSGNHLTQTTGGALPRYNTYATSGGPSSSAVNPFGPQQNLYQTNDLASIYFDGGNTFLNIPTSLALTTSGCTVIICSRGASSCPIGLGTDSTNFLGYGFTALRPAKMGIINGVAHHWSKSTFLPYLTPTVHGFRCSAALSETRLYMGAHQTDAQSSNLLTFNTTGGAVGRMYGSLFPYGHDDFLGEIFEVAIFSAPLTDAQAAQVLARMQDANGIRPDANSNLVAFVGDSLTVGNLFVPAWHTYPFKLCQMYSGAIKPLMQAVVGHTIAQQQSLTNELLLNLDLTAYTQAIAVVCCGTNDIGSAGRTDTQVQTDFQSLCQSLQNGGYKVIAVVPQNRDSASSFNSTMQSYMANFQTWMRGNYRLFADALVDWAADARIGDSNISDPAYFISDHLHGTETGDRVKAALVKPAVDSLASLPALTPVSWTYGRFYTGGRSIAESFGFFVKV